MMRQRVPIAKVLEDPQIDPEVKRKLQLAQETLKFSEEQLGLNTNKNYQTYVDLKRPYVTWIVQASPINKIEAYTWWFPIVGSLPYKGFFTEEEAQAEAKKFDTKKFDTAVRGASAYSTLGWFHDPILSSMLRYDDADLVDTLIHESVHATLFISSHADFNERMATFFGDQGAELFYLAKQGPDSLIAKQIRLENDDHLVFSKWMGQQIEDLKKFYETRPTPEKKSERLKKMVESFTIQLKPQLKTKSFLYFSKLNLNNAVLLNYTTYDQDLTDFAKLYKKYGDYRKALVFLKTLRDSKDPQKDLQKSL